MRIYSADIETDGFNSSKIWVVSISELDSVTMKVKRSFSLTDYDKIRLEMSKPDVFWIFHNGYNFDKPQLEKILKCKLEGSLIDTLGLSWYLYPKNVKHGLESWGEEFGVPKPVIDDWEGLSIEEYIHRCEEDVKIQTKLWQQMWRHLNLLYNKDLQQIWRLVEYINSKMYALSLAYKGKWKVDIDKAKKLKDDLETIFEEAKDNLERAMPQVPVYAKKQRPKKPFKKDGSLSATGMKWASICEEYNKDFDYMGEIKVLTGYKDPNAGSVPQIKNWLYDLGWKPETFEFKRDKESGEVKQIPQIKDKESGELCNSIKKLLDKEPSLKYLENMGIVKHRASIVKGFIDNSDEDGYIKAQAQGFTNTLRLKHRVAVNIPSNRKPYGEDIRGLLKARDDKHELLGSDMSSLEDRTKQHYMWEYDPDYVTEMLTPGFDPHCDMAVEAGLMTKEEVDEYKSDSCTGKRKAELSAIRYAGKTTNYASTYGAGAATIARAAGVEEKLGQKLHDAYWSRNWSLKAIADNCVVKESRGVKWLLNPINNFWYYLKAEKDRFSTLNQGTGSFLFDQWVNYILYRRPQINGQFHDEIILEINKGHREEAEKLLREAIEYVNSKYKLNRNLDIDVQFGDNYAGIH